MGQAADHPAGALVQVLAQPGKGAGPVAVQPQRGIQRGQQAGPFGLERERAGADQHAAAGDLPAPDSGEQPGPLDVDAA